MPIYCTPFQVKHELQVVRISELKCVLHNHEGELSNVGSFYREDAKDRCQETFPVGSQMVEIERQHLQIDLHLVLSHRLYYVLAVMAEEEETSTSASTFSCHENHRRIDCRVQ